MAKDSFVFYKSFYEACCDLGGTTSNQSSLFEISEQEKLELELYRSIAKYALGEIEDLDSLHPTVKAIMRTIKPQIDANLKRYENGRKGGRPKNLDDKKDNLEQTKRKPKENQKKPKGENAKPNVNVNVNDNDNVNDNKRFVKPTLEELQNYINDKGLNVDSQVFMDYYNSNGWKVGRNSMKDWKATVRRWSKNDFKGNSRVIKDKALPSYMEEKIKPKNVSKEELEEVQNLLRRIS